VKMFVDGHEILDIAGVHNRRHLYNFGCGENPVRWGSVWALREKFVQGAVSLGKLD